MENKNLLPIVDLYTCIQGEGKLMGVPHILIRLSGCPLRCKFCDTSYAGFNKPEKGKYSWKDLVKIFDKNLDKINHTLITGGEPFIHTELLKSLCEFAKKREHYITIETSGIIFLKLDYDLLSLSPKLSNSSPLESSPFYKQHQKYMDKFSIMNLLIDQQCLNNNDYQVKFVYSNFKDLVEIEGIIDNELFLPKNTIWLMPEGKTDKELLKKRKKMAKICIKKGYNYSDRLHILMFGGGRKEI